MKKCHECGVSVLSGKIIDGMIFCNECGKGFKVYCECGEPNCPMDESIKIESEDDAGG